MSVTEQVEGWGSWSVQLKPETPGAVWEVLNPDVNAFGHVIVTGVRIDPAAVGDSGLLAAARYSGLYRGTRSRGQLSGVGLVAWLGDEDGKGEVFETDQLGVDPTGGGAATGSFVAWIRDLLPAAIEEGTLNAIAGTYTEVLRYMSPREALGRVMDFFGGTYRINPDATIDAGEPADLFAITPEVVLLWEGGGPDSAAVGFEASGIDLSRDLDDYTTRVALLAEGEGPAIALGTADLPSVPYSDFHGNDVVRTRLVDAADVSPANADTMAAAQLGRFNDVRKSYQLSTPEWGVRVVDALTKPVEPGDFIWVYDPRPDAKLVDTANQLHYQGRPIFPVLLRLEAITWPVAEGMGVYFRYWPSGLPVVTVDLTDYVAWDSGDTTFQVGASPRRSPDTRQAAIQARVAGRAFLVGDTLRFTGGDTFDHADFPGLRRVRFRAQGPGGAGGGAATTAAGQTSLGSGGGAGAYVEGEVDVEGLSASETITVGTGGAGVSGAGGNNGSGPTSFGSHGSAPAGSGGATLAAGTTDSTTLGGNGGAATLDNDETEVWNGAQGGMGLRLADGATGRAGQGAASPSGGKGGDHGGNNTNGGSGQHGGGGGGGLNIGASGSTRAGGAGGDGWVELDLLY